MTNFALCGVKIKKWYITEELSFSFLNFCIQKIKSFHSHHNINYYGNKTIFNINILIETKLIDLKILKETLTNSKQTVKLQSKE